MSNYDITGFASLAQAIQEDFAERQKERPDWIPPLGPSDFWREWFYRVLNTYDDHDEQSAVQIKDWRFFDDALPHALAAEEERIRREAASSYEFELKMLRRSVERFLYVLNNSPVHAELIEAEDNLRALIEDRE